MTPTKKPLTVTSTPVANATLTVRSNSIAGPSWWPGDLRMPPGFEYQGESDSDKPIPYRIARWVTPDKDLDALRDQLVKVGQDAGYQVTVLEKANGLSHYNVEFLKGTRVFQLSIFGLVNTMVNGHALPTIQFKTTGATTQVIVVPVGDWLTQSGTPLHLTARVQNGQCTGCLYSISITIPTFKGPGNYSTVAVDAIPGGDSTTGDYGNPTNCSIVVKDEFDGTFECQGLKNKADPTKTIDLSGSWQAPLL